MQKQKGLPLRAFAIFLLAALIGVAGGLLGSIFQNGLYWIHHLLIGVERTKDALTGVERTQGLSAAVRENLAWWQTLLVPTAGGFAAGLVLLVLRGKKPPFGVADLVVLVQLRKGTIRLRESMLQIVSSACTIGSGGSIGREGANSQIAATVAALVARATKLGSRPRAVLIGCGIAAGMATSYNAPIAGAIFVMEVVLGNFAMAVFAPIVVSAVLATIVRSEFLPETAIYEETAKGLAKLSPGLVLAALVLGVLCGIGGILFRLALASGRQLFARLHLPPPLAMALGGLVVGGIGVFMPETWGNGFEVIKVVAHGTPSVALIVTLFFWKQVATVSTVGSGGLGGIFTPNLVIGAAFGGLFAYALGFVAPISDGERAAFAFVGMAGLCAATMHAPVTAVVLVFELTGHYELTLPVMLCSIVASIAASLIDELSYYTAAIKAKGEELPGGIEDLAIRTTFVRDVLRADCVTVPDTAGFAEVMALLGSHRGDTVYVQDAGGALIGRIDLQDVKTFLNDPTLTAAVIAADLTRPVVTALPDDSIATVMPHFDDPELREIAVVSAGQPQRLLGRVLHQDVITTLGSEVLGQQRRNTRFSFGGETVRLPPGVELRTLPVPDSWVGLAVDALPSDGQRELVVLMASHKEGGREVRVTATPGLVLQAGWQLVVMGTPASIQRLQHDAGTGEQ
ncbi:MAG TPA: chloride channel protein [Planctomycetota bacterium]|nr:chloride channel protein [Planctomycetota bacterium]